MSFFVPSFFYLVPSRFPSISLLLFFFFGKLAIFRLFLFFIHGIGSITYRSDYKLYYSRTTIYLLHLCSNFHQPQHYIQFYFGVSVVVADWYFFECFFFLFFLRISTSALYLLSWSIQIICRRHHRYIHTSVKFIVTTKVSNSSVHIFTNGSVHALELSVYDANLCVG